MKIKISILLILIGFTASAQWANFNPYGVQKSASGDSLRLVGSATGQYLNVPTTKMLRSAITASAYTAGYGMSLAGQQFRVDTNIVANLTKSNYYNNDAIQKIGNIYSYGKFSVAGNYSTMNRHSFDDYSIITSSTDQNLGYGVFDASTELRGTANNDHLIGYQARMINNSSITGNGFMGYYTRLVNNGNASHMQSISIGNVNNGSLNLSTGIIISQPYGSGTIGGNSGIIIQDMDKGSSSNYAIYTNKGVVRFGDQVIAASMIVDKKPTLAPEVVRLIDLANYFEKNGDNVVTGSTQFVRPVFGVPAINDDQFVVKSQLNSKLNTNNPTATGTLTTPQLRVTNFGGGVLYSDASGNINNVNVLPVSLGGTGVTASTGTGSVFVLNNAPTLINPQVGTQAVNDNSVKAASTAYADRAASNNVQNSLIPASGTKAASVDAVNVGLNTSANWKGESLAVTSKAVGDFIYYNGTNWINKQITATAPLSWNNTTGNMSFNDSAYAKLSGGNLFTGFQTFSNGSSQPIAGFSESGFLNSLQSNTLTTNVITYLPSDGGQLVNDTYTGKKQVLTASGNGSATTISIAHGMTGVTSSSWVSAIANNVASSGIQYVTVDASNVNIFYTVAPVSGTNNLLYSIEVKK